jgi:8-oxo-dGTP pyrophosphatase MutT (NUDIX family)
VSSAAVGNGDGSGAGAGAGGFRALDETEVHRGPLISVGRGRFCAPDGTVFEREVVHHPGAVVVVPLVDASSALLVRQYRAAVGAELLELPAGKRDVSGEPTEVTAERELVEEVGRRPGHLELLGCFYNSPGFCDEYTWLYLATDLVEVPDDRQGLEEQAMTVQEVRLADVAALVASGELVDAKSIVGLCLAAGRAGADGAVCMVGVVI